MNVNTCQFTFIKDHQFLCKWSIIHEGGNADKIQQFLIEKFNEEVKINPKSESKEFNNEKSMLEYFKAYSNDAAKSLKLKLETDINSSKMIFTKFDFDHAQNASKDQSSCEFSYEGKKYKIIALSSNSEFYNRIIDVE